MVCESIFPTVKEDEMTGNQVNKGPTDEYDLGYKGDSGGCFLEEVHRAVRMSRMGDACHQLKQEKRNLFSSPRERSWVGS